MSGFYVFAKHPDETDALFDKYIEKLTSYKAQQVSVGNDPGEILGYVYNAGDFAKTFGISKRAARRLINRWFDSGVLIEYRGKVAG